MSYRPTDRFQNWFITSLQTGINDTTSSFRLNDNLNVSQTRLVIDPYDESVREVVKVTSVDGNLVYVERGDDNTPASYHQEGAIVAMNVVAADMNDLYADFAGVVDATDDANQAASAASSAASSASNAASAATTATGLANTATSNANAATSAANSAAGSANSAASSANTAAGNAQTAADNAQGIVDDVAGAVASNILPIRVDKINNRVGVGKTPVAGRMLDVDGDIYSNGEKVLTGLPSGSVVALSGGAKIQSGWGYINGNGTPTLTASPTFSTSFSAPPLVIVGFLSAAATSAGTPSSPASFNTPWTSFSGAYATGITASSFQVKLEARSNHSSSYNFGYSWIAIGT